MTCRNGDGRVRRGRARFDHRAGEFSSLGFRRRQKPWLVRAAHHAAQLGLVCLAWAIVGALWLVFDFVAGRTVSLIVLAVAAAFYAMLWWGAPLAGRGHLGRQDEAT